MKVSEWTLLNKTDEKEVYGYKDFHVVFKRGTLCDEDLYLDHNPTPISIKADFNNHQAFKRIGEFINGTPHNHSEAEITEDIPALYEDGSFLIGSSSLLNAPHKLFEYAPNCLVIKKQVLGVKIKYFNAHTGKKEIPSSRLAFTDVLSLKAYAKQTIDEFYKNNDLEIASRQGYSLLKSAKDTNGYILVDKNHKEHPISFASDDLANYWFNATTCKRGALKLYSCEIKNNGPYNKCFVFSNHQANAGSYCEKVVKTTNKSAYTANCTLIISPLQALPNINNQFLVDVDTLTELANEHGNAVPQETKSLPETEMEA